MRYEIYPSIILLLYTLGDDCHYNSKSEYIMHVGDMDIEGTYWHEVNIYRQQE